MHCYIYDSEDRWKLTYFSDEYSRSRLMVSFAVFNKSLSTLNLEKLVYLFPNAIKSGLNWLYIIDNTVILSTPVIIIGKVAFVTIFKQKSSVIFFFFLFLVKKLISWKGT